MNTFKQHIADILSQPPIILTELDDVISFATLKHAGQVRKFNGEPYVEHPIRVAQHVKSVGGNLTLQTVALLHDTLEDTETTFEELSTQFGKEVADMVSALTNDPVRLTELGKAEYLAQKLNTLSTDALLVKLADRLDNVSDLYEGFESTDSKRREWAERYAAETRYSFFDKLQRTDLDARHTELLELIEEALTYG